MLELRVLHFEDLTVGMSETFSKVVSSSDVVGFAEFCCKVPFLRVESKSGYKDFKGLRMPTTSKNQLCNRTSHTAYH